MLLQLENIKKYFPVKKGVWGHEESFVRAVDDVSLNIKKGENVGLVGESGCGKTTLGRIILKLLPLDSGSIYFKGEDLTNIPDRYFKDFRKYIQMVFQDPDNSLDPRFTIRRVLREAMILAKDEYRTEEQKENRAKDLMEAVNLQPDMLNRYPHEFSGGERQRIAIAHPLGLNPKLLILDEAVSSLDVIIQEQLIELLLELQRQFHLTYLFISHNLKVVKKISQTIAVMYKGKIVELASTQEIFNNPLHPYTKQLLAAAVEYKSVKSEKDINISPTAQLIDRGDGHLVMEP